MVPRFSLQKLTVTIGQDHGKLSQLVQDVEALDTTGMLAYSCDGEESLPSLDYLLLCLHWIGPTISIRRTGLSDNLE